MSEPLPRFEVVKHTDHRTHAFQVRNLVSDERFGYGMTLFNAIELADSHDVAYQRGLAESKSALGQAQADLLMASRPWSDA